MKRPRLSVVLAALALGAAGAWALLRPAPLDEEAALVAYVELRLAQQELGDTTAAARSARDAILAKRGLDRARLAAWLESWKENPALWEERQNRLIAAIDTLRREFEPKPAPRPAAAGAKPDAAPEPAHGPRHEVAPDPGRGPRPEPGIGPRPKHDRPEPGTGPHPKRVRPEEGPKHGPRGGRR